MPTIVGGANRVVEHEGLTIDEYAGNVATKDDRISIALVNTGPNPASEPWLTLHYDEWMAVIKGRMVLLHGSGEEQLEVRAGQTVFIGKGERFRPTFPDGDCQYVPVCLPAFRPDRCIREEEPGQVMSKLAGLHGGETAAAAAMETEPPPASDGAAADDPHPEVLYHMALSARWEAAKAGDEAYWPPTFEQDGFTHATAVPGRLLDTANHFYQQSVGEWVCLRFARSALLRRGIVVKDEDPMPVGAKAADASWGGAAAWVCPHVYGGIPPAVVDREFVMTREAGGAFTAIAGLA